MDYIVIPSAGRHKRQQTLACLERTSLIHSYQVVLLVPRKELDKYRRPSYKGRPIKRSTMQDIIVEPEPEDCIGISQSRAYVLTTWAKKNSAENILMLDDDLSFCHRPNLDKPDMPYINDNTFRMLLMVETLAEWLEEGMVHVGLISRQANRNIGIEYQQPGRLMNAYAYDSRTIRKLIDRGDLKLNRVPVMEDFDLTLQLLKLGYPSRVSCQFAWTQTSNMDGGCSTYRTADVQAKAAYKLAKLHEPFVQIVTGKKAKTWKNNLTERVDVRIAWKKAFEFGLSQKRLRRAA